MLQNEITPFASANRLQLEDVINVLKKTQIKADGKIEINSVQAVELIRKLQTAQHAFDRFEACMLDEWSQKENYRKMFLEMKGIHT